MNPGDDITTQEALDMISTLQNCAITLIKQTKLLGRSINEVQLSLGYILTRVGEVETLLEQSSINPKKKISNKNIV